MLVHAYVCLPPQAALALSSDCTPPCYTLALAGFTVYGLKALLIQIRHAYEAHHRSVLGFLTGLSPSCTWACACWPSAKSHAAEGHRC